MPCGEGIDGNGLMILMVDASFLRLAHNSPSDGTTEVVESAGVGQGLGRGWRALKPPRAGCCRLSLLR